LEDVSRKGAWLHFAARPFFLNVLCENALCASEPAAIAGSLRKNPAGVRLRAPFGVSPAGNRRRCFYAGCPQWRLARLRTGLGLGGSFFGKSLSAQASQPAGGGQTAEKPAGNPPTSPLRGLSGGESAEMFFRSLPAPRWLARLREGWDGV